MTAIDPRSAPDPRPLESPGADPLLETIVAISTPPGRGGVGVVRLSGPRAAAVAWSLFRPAGGRGEAPPPGRTAFGTFVDGKGRGIDHGYLVLFEPPASFTGEPQAELWGHGSPAALRRIVEGAVELGARPATPGEFTLRAFLNGRIDVTQAEAIRDLIEARTAYQAGVALQQVHGRVSAPVNRLKERLAELVARLEASIEFSEEGEAGRFLPAAGALPETRSLLGEIESLAGTWERGRRVRDGATILLAGLPNVGKSSLFNRLLEEERAIVTPIAGTTRDVLEETLDLGGVPAALLDTAGLRETADAAVSEGVRRARLALETADVPVLVLDGSRPLEDEETALLAGLAPGRGVVVVNKSDLPRRIREIHGALRVSARSGAGIDRLRLRLEEIVTGGAVAGREQPFITNVRHHDLLSRAAAALRRALVAAGEGVGEECLLLDYRDALDRLGEITGEVGIEGIYERIFRNFCIGK